MLQSISWQEYLTAVAMLAGGYYAITLLLLYSDEITAICRRKKFVPLDQDINSDQNELKASGLMGKVRYESSKTPTLREEKVEAQNLVAVPQEPEEPITEAKPDISEEEILTNGMAKLLEEIKTLAAVAEGHTKEESIPLFQSLLSNYAHLAGTPHEEDITRFIYESWNTKSELDLELDEIRSWWPKHEGE